MADIPNTAYITVKRNKNGEVGVFVGGKPATHYRGVNIYDINYVKDIFAWIQGQNPNITELHVLSSETSGGYATVGNPSSTHGIYAWCRVKYKDGQFGGWFFDDAYTSATALGCAHICAARCAHDVRANVAFRRAVLGTALDKQNVETNSVAKSENPEIEELKAVDLSKLVGKTVQFNGYVVTVKIAETEQKGR